MAVISISAVAVLGVAPMASAESSTQEFTRAEVKAWVQDNGAMKDGVCGAFPWPFGWLCSQFGGANANGGMEGAFQDAANNNCGIRMEVTATGSGNSYDKANYKYTKINCA